MVNIGSASTPIEFVLLNSVAHAKLKVLPVNGYSFVKENHLVSLVLHELPKIAANYATVFVKRQNSEKFMPMALLGLEEKRNFFVGDKGQWLAGAYVPAAFRRYPFALAQTDPNEMALCIDIHSESLSQEEGVELFDAQGQPTESLEKIKHFLFETYQSELAAENFCDRLVELKLLVPASFKVQGPAGVKQYDGCFVVDEQKLASLGVDDFLGLRVQGYLAAIYAHLISLQQIEKLGAFDLPPVSQTQSI